MPSVRELAQRIDTQEEVEGKRTGSHEVWKETREQRRETERIQMEEDEAQQEVSTEEGSHRADIEAKALTEQATIQTQFVAELDGLFEQIKTRLLDQEAAKRSECEAETMHEHQDLKQRLTEEAEHTAREESERKARIESEQRTKEEAKRKARIEADNIEAERQAKEKAREEQVLKEAEADRLQQESQREKSEETAHIEELRSSHEAMVEAEKERQRALRSKPPTIKDPMVKVITLCTACMMVQEGPKAVRNTVKALSALIVLETAVSYGRSWYKSAHY